MKLPLSLPLVHLSDGTVDLRHHLVHRGGQTRSLTTKESELLGYLASRSGEAIPRDTLHQEVWGYSATVVSRAVDTTVRRLRMKVEGDPSRPRHLITVHGVGYQWVKAHSQDAPRERSASAHTLEIEPDGFFGREGALQSVGDCLADGARLVSVVGPPGTGKTRLVRRYGATQLSRLKGRVWCCDLAEVDSVEGVASSVARALGTPLSGGNGVERVSEVLAERGSLLMILDNCEGVVSLAHATIGRWLRKAPQARFVVTSRERLREPGEVVLELKPLQQPAAVALFMDRARSVNRAFTADACLLNDIVDRLECLPLAIELAAARTNVLSAQVLYDRLSHPLQVLGHGPRSAPVRGESLRGALDASWDILQPWERSALAQCSVFRGGFTVDAVEAVLDVSPFDGAPWVVDIVQTLQDKSLIASYSPDDMPGELRLRLYQSVRDYAAEQLDDDALIQRYRAFYLSLGERLVGALDGPEASAALQRLELERDNLLWVHRSASEGAPSDRVRAVTVLDPLLSAHGPLDVQLELLDGAVSACQGVSPRLRGQVYRLRGEARRVRGQIEGAQADLDVALSIGESQGLSDLESRTLSSLSFLHGSTGRVDEALALASRALQLHRARSDRAYESLMRMTIGVLKKKSGNPMEAEEHYREALAIQRDHGVIRFQGLTLLNLANLMRARNQLDEAERLYAQSSEAFGRFGHLRWQATSLHNQAALCAQRGDLDMARDIAERALKVAREGGETLTVVHVLHCLGHVLHLQGRLEEAERAYGGAISRLTDVDPILQASSRGDLGALQADQGRTEQSERTLKSVEAVLATAAPEMMQVLALHWGHLDVARARAASRSGYDDEAERHLAQARRRLVEVEEAAAESDTRPRMAMRLLHHVLERL